MSRATATAPRLILRASRGYSFLELFIAVSLLALTFVPLLSLMLAGHSGTAFTLAQARAFAMAADLAEAIGSLDYAQVSQTSVEGLARSLPRGADQQGFDLKVTVFEPEKFVPVPTAPGRVLRYRTISIVVGFPRRAEGLSREERARVSLGIVRSELGEQGS